MFLSVIFGEFWLIFKLNFYFPTVCAVIIISFVASWCLTMRLLWSDDVHISVWPSIILPSLLLLFYLLFWLQFFSHFSFCFIFNFYFCLFHSDIFYKVRYLSSILVVDWRLVTVILVNVLLCCHQAVASFFLFGCSLPVISCR